MKIKKKHSPRPLMGGELKFTRLLLDFRRSIQINLAHLSWLQEELFLPALRRDHVNAIIIFLLFCRF